MLNKPPTTTPEQPAEGAAIAARDSSHTAIRSALPITERQLNILSTIERYIAARVYPPTVRDLCDLLGVSSTSGMLEHLRALERKGYIARDEGEARGLRVLVPARDAGAPIAPRPLAKGHVCRACGSRVA